jgi:hypothetical protein
MFKRWRGAVPLVDPKQTRGEMHARVARASKRFAEA